MKISENKQFNPENLHQNAEETLNLGYREEERKQLIRQNYIDIINIVSEAIYVLDESFSFIEVNKGAEKMYQFTREELIGQTPDSVAAPGMNDMPTVLQMMQSVLQTGKEVKFDFWAKRKNGEIFPKSVIVNKGKFFEQNVLIATARDITEQKEVEQKLILRDSEFIDLFENAPIGYHEIDAEGKIIRINETELNLLGYTLAEVIGQYFWKFTVNEAICQQDITAKLAGTLHPGISYERNLRRKDGAILSVLVTDRLIKSPEGKITGIRSNVHDNTSRKIVEVKLQKREAELDTLINTLPDLVWLKDTDGVYINCNKRFELFFGAKKESIVGKSDYDFMSEELADFFRGHDKNAISEGKPTINEEWVTYANDGHSEFLETIKTPMYDDDGNLIGVLGIGRDITERKNTEKLVRENYDLLSKLTAQVPGVVYQYRLYPDGHSAFPYSSEGMYDIYEVTPDEVREDASPVFTRIHPDDYDNIVDTIMESARNQTIYHSEFRVILPQKGLRWRKCDAKPELLEDGSTLWYGIITDITEQKEVENTLKESEERFKVLFEKAPDAMFLAETETRKIVDANAAACRLFKKEKTELIGLYQYELHPKKIISKSKEEFDIHSIQSPNAEIIIPIENIIITSEGNEIPVEILGQTIKIGEKELLLGTFRDIRVRKNTLDILKRSEERYSSLLQHLETGVVVHAADTSIITSNPRASELLGLSIEQMKGKVAIDPAWCFLNPDNSTMSLENYPVNRVLNTKQLIRNQILGIKQSSSAAIIWVTVNGFPVLNNENEITEIVISFNDITERKLAEEKIIESERELKRQNGLFDSLIRNLPMGVFMVEAPSGKPLLANDAALTLLGRGILPDANRENLHDVYDAYKTGCNEKYPVDEMPVIRGMKGESSRIDDMLVKRPDGTDTLLEIFGSPVTDEIGNIWASLVSFMDISDRKKAELALKESEEKLSALFGAMTEMVVIHELVFDKSGNAVDYRLLDCNEAFCSITGMKKLDVVGKLATEVYQTDSAPYLDIYCEIAISGNSYEFTRYYAPMDKHFRISVVSPSKNHFATITADITAMKHAQDEILYKSKELENYLYVASHDLRSPLVNIQGFSQRLQKQSSEIKAFSEKLNVETEVRKNMDKLTNEDMPRTLNFIQTNVTKMNNLIDSLLQISRTGRMPLEIKELDMNMLLNKVIVSYNYELTELGALIKTEDLRPCFGDENQLNQVFSNIIGNALKYRSPDRKPEIKISSKQTHNRIVYSISDNGKGIAERHLKKIWDVFYRIDPLASEAGEGIGLSITKTIVTKHKGHVWVESEENKGSTFYIELLKNNFSEF